MTPIQKRNDLEKIGFTFYPIELKDNEFVCSAWKNDVYISTGKKIYKTHSEALFKTESAFYDRYKTEITHITTLEKTEV